MKNSSVLFSIFLAFGATSDEIKIFFWILNRISQNRSERIFEHIPRKLTEFSKTDITKTILKDIISLNFILKVVMWYII